jgi:hypothetical protein
MLSITICNGSDETLNVLLCPTHLVVTRRSQDYLLPLFPHFHIAQITLGAIPLYIDSSIV